MADRQIFALGVGCQKAGSTWLWDYLSAHRDVAFAKPKEVHAFDAMLRPDLNAEFFLRAQVKSLSRSRQRTLFGAKKEPRDPRYVTPEIQMDMIGDPQVYVDFFRSMAPEARVVGENTPSYSTLLPAHFRMIREWLEPHFDLRIVLLLRDPVQRAFSAAKHFKRVFKETYPFALDVEENEYLDSILTTSYVLERQDYQRVLTGLEATFEPEQLHVEFYERLFTPEAVRKVTDFLGLSPLEADFDKRVNAGLANASSLDPDLAAKARRAYSDTYAYCEERFGKDLISDLWMPAA